MTAWCCLLPACCLAACTGGRGAGPQPTATDRGEIVVASGLDVTGSDGVRQQLIDRWNHTPLGRDHPARLVELPGGADQQRSQLLGALQSGSARYDVVNLDVTWVPEFAQAGLIGALDHQVDLAQDFIGPVAATATWHGHTYAVPFNSDVGLLYYRPDYLKRVGVEPANYPKKSGMTWGRLQSLITSVDEVPAADRPAGYQKGWTSQLAPHEGLTVNIVEALASADVRLADGDGHYTADASDLGRGLEALSDRTDNEYTLPAARDSDEAQSLSDFAAGRTAFLRHWPYAYRVLAQTLSADKVAVAPLPGRAVLGGQDLAVAAGSPRSSYALALIRYLTRPQSERCLLDAGFAATRESAYTGSSVRCDLPPSPASPPSAAAPGRTEVHDMPRDPQGRPAYAATTLLTALRSAVQRPRTPYYGAFTQVLQSRLHAWLFNPDRAPTDQTAAALDRALARAFRGK